MIILFQFHNLKTFVCQLLFCRSLNLEGLVEKTTAEYGVRSPECGVPTHAKDGVWKTRSPKKKGITLK